MICNTNVSVDSFVCFLLGPSPFVFAPLEHLWNALEVWFSLLAEEIQQQENEGNCTSISEADVESKIPCQEVYGPSSADGVSTAQSSDIVNSSVRDVLSGSVGEVSTQTSTPDNIPSENGGINREEEPFGSTQEESASSRRSVSADSKNSGLVRQHSRHIAAALMATRPKIAQRTLSLSPSNDSIRLSQPAVEMNLGRWSGDFARGWGNFTNNDNPSTVVTAEEVNGSHETSLANSRPELGLSLNSGTQQMFGARIGLTTHPMSPLVDSTIISRDNTASGQLFAPNSGSLNMDIDEHERQLEAAGGVSTNQLHQQSETGIYSGNSNVVEDTPKEKPSGTISPVPGRDVVSMTAERLCAVTRGLYLCCCCQTQWEFP